MENMENIKNWKIDGDTLTIKITNKVSVKDLNDIMNAVFKYEQKYIPDYYAKYSYWGVETSIDENNIVEIKK